MGGFLRNYGGLPCEIAYLLRFRYGYLPGKRKRCKCPLSPPRYGIIYRSISRIQDASYAFRNAQANRLGGRPCAPMISPRADGGRSARTREGEPSARCGPSRPNIGATRSNRASRDGRSVRRVGTQRRMRRRYCRRVIGRMSRSAMSTGDAPIIRKNYIRTGIYNCDSAAVVSFQRDRYMAHRCSTPFIASSVACSISVRWWWGGGGGGAGGGVLGGRGTGRPGKRRREHFATREYISIRATIGISPTRHPPSAS